MTSDSAEVADRTSPWRDRLTSLFGIDPRTLALCRIATAAVLLYDLVARATELRIMYSDDGLFPIADVREFWGPNSWRWSWHMLNGNVSFQAAMFGIAVLFGLLMLAGCFTRLATIASWILLVSLHTRAPVLVTGGDILLQMTIFWAMFLPWGQRASVDAWRRGTIGARGPVLSMASAAILLQVGFMYFFTAFSKCNYLWFQGKAIESVFLNPMFARPLAHWLAGYPDLLTLLTYATLVLELVGPLLLFCPWRTSLVRTITLVCFVILHIGIEMTMYVVIFSFSSLAALMLFVPSTFWSLPPVRRLSRWAPGRHVSTPAPPALPKRSAAARAGEIAGTLVCATVLAYVVLINPLVYFGRDWKIARVSDSLRAFRDIAALGQEWSMFACPASHNYRYVAVANLRDGTQVDVLRKEAFDGVDRPEQLSLEPPSQRWVQIMVDLTRPHRYVFQRSLIRYLANQWNADQPPSRQIDHIQLDFMYETPAAADGPPVIEKLVLARYDPYSDGVYLSGRRHGHWVHHYPNGRREAEGDYRHGAELGHWTLWYEDGRKQAEGSYVDGQLDGRWTFYYEQGQQVTAFFERGRLVPHTPTQEEARSVPQSGLRFEEHP